jgi:hypothetical protein
MARASEEKHAELEGLWRSHREGLEEQRDQFKIEDEVRHAGLRYRRGRLLAVR